LSVFPLAAGLFALRAIQTLSQSSVTLLGIIPDDAFYYLQVARHIAESGMSTADGISRTNGYHPLWMAVCVLLAFVTKGWTMVRVALALSLGFHLATALAVRSLVRMTRARELAGVAAACWLLNPLAYTIATQTVEAPLYTFALTLALICHLLVAEALRSGERVPAVRYGLALGFVWLARVEGAILVALGMAWLGWQVRRLPGRRRALLAASVCIALLVIPWLLFSYAQVGTIVPDSGAMKALWTTDLFPTSASRLRNVIDSADFFGRTAPRLALGWHIPTALLALIHVTVGGSLLTVAVRDRSRSDAALAQAILAGTVAVLAVYAIAFSDRQIWWLALPTLGLFLGVWTVIGACLAETSAGRLRSAASLAAVGLSAAGLFLKTGAPLYPWQPDVYFSQAKVEALVPHGARLGSFNAGIPMFFGTGREVALDGIVSHGALLSWRRHAVDDYLRANGVAYIVDEQRSLNRALGFFRTRPDFIPIAEFPLAGWPTGRRILWRIDFHPQSR
jgi:4-amino-4-deoxy-L-arabinose transferase-like glycosyltransferase